MLLPSFRKDVFGLGDVNLIVKLNFEGVSYIFISQHYQDLAIDLVTSGPVKIAALSSWLCSISQEIDHVFRHRCLDQRKEEIYTNNDKDMFIRINLN